MQTLTREARSTRPMSAMPSISDPVLRQVGEQDQRYAVCMRANTRDINRRYTGDQERIA